MLYHHQRYAVYCKAGFDVCAPQAAMSRLLGWWLQRPAAPLRSLGGGGTRAPLDGTTRFLGRRRHFYREPGSEPPGKASSACSSPSL